jgi:hypothetical protein
MATLRLDEEAGPAGPLLTICNISVENAVESAPRFGVKHNARKGFVTDCTQIKQNADRVGKPLF